jgi:DNA-binding response OmpR family regulator
MAKILVVEDEDELAEVICEWLGDEQHTVDRVSDGTEAAERLRFYTYDIVVLDWNLPGLPGIEVCRSFRKQGGAAPVLMLTGKAEIENKEEGLDAGADDYLTKPFHPRELTARIRALLRRPHEVASALLKAADIELDTQKMRVLKGGKEVHLLKREFCLLEFLMRHPNQVFSSEALLERVWSSESDSSPDTVRVHITKLRNKIDTEGAPSLIRTFHRQGYAFEPPEISQETLSR